MRFLFPKLTEDIEDDLKERNSDQMKMIARNDVDWSNIDQDNYENILTYTS